MEDSMLESLMSDMTSRADHARMQNMSANEHHATLVRDASPPPSDNVAPLRFGSVSVADEDEKTSFVLTRKRRLIRDDAYEQAMRESLGVLPDEYINPGLKMCNMIKHDSLPKVRCHGDVEPGLKSASGKEAGEDCNEKRHHAERAHLPRKHHTDKKVTDVSPLTRHNCNVGSFDMDSENQTFIHYSKAHPDIALQKTINSNGVGLSASHLDMKTVSHLNSGKQHENSVAAFHTMYTPLFNDESIGHTVHTLKPSPENSCQPLHRANDSGSMESHQLSAQPGKYDRNYYSGHSILSFIPDFKQLSTRRKILINSSSQTANIPPCIIETFDDVCSQRNKCSPSKVGSQDEDSAGNSESRSPSRCYSITPDVAQSAITTRSGSRKNRKANDLCNYDACGNMESGTATMLTRSKERKNRSLLLVAPTYVYQSSDIALSRKQKTHEYRPSSCRQRRNVTNSDGQRMEQSLGPRSQATGTNIRRSTKRRRLSKKKNASSRRRYEQTSMKIHGDTRSYNVTDGNTIPSRWQEPCIIYEPGNDLSNSNELSPYSKFPVSKQDTCNSLCSVQNADSSDRSNKDPFKISQSRRLFAKIHELSKWAFDKIARNTRGD